MHSCGENVSPMHKSIKAWILFIWESLSWGHAHTFQSVSGQDWLERSSRRIFFCSRSVVDLLLRFGSLSCCIIQLLLCFNLRTDGHPPAKCPNKLGNLFFCQWWQALRAPRRHSSSKPRCLLHHSLQITDEGWCWCAVLLSTYVFYSILTTQEQDSLPTECLNAHSCWHIDIDVCMPCTRDFCLALILQGSL